MGAEENLDLSQLLANSAELAAPARATLMSIVSRLCGGLTAFPRALLQRPLQGIRDGTSARSLVSAQLAAAAANAVAADKELVKLAAEAYIPEEIRKLRNKARIAVAAAEDFSTENSQTAAEPDEDWLNKFIRYAEDASSERLQTLFGKILSGEVKRPGSFSPATLRAVSELTQELASDFEWAWKRCIEDEVWRGPDLSRGDGWNRLTRLRDAGLMSPVASSVHQPAFRPDTLYSPWIFGRIPHPHLVLEMTRASGLEIPVVNFTSVGAEIGKLLPEPDIEANLLQVAGSINRSSVAKITLLRSDGTTSLLWEAP